MRSSSDQQRTWTDCDFDSAFDGPRLTVEVVFDRARGLDDRPANLAGHHARRAVGRPRREMPRMPEPGNDGPILDDRRIEQSIVEPGTCRQPDAVAVLAAIGEGDGQRPYRPALAVELDFVVLAAIPASLAHADEDVRPAPARALGSHVEQPGYARVDADAGDVEERTVAEDSRVDGADRTVQRSGDCGARLERRPQRRRQAVARAGRDQAKRTSRPEQRGSGFVDGAIAAPDDDQLRAVEYRGAREGLCVTRVLRHVNVCTKSTPPRLIGEDCGTVFCGVGVGASTGNRVDDRDG